MSKSYGNSINISDEPKVLWEKLRTMKTDPARMRKTDPGDPAKCPVWDIHMVFNKNEAERAELDQGCRTAGIGCIECKKKLNAHILEVLAPIQERRSYFAKNPGELEDLLLLGATKARKVASQTMEEVVSSMGLIRRVLR
jgi:tryptophanyl-tRNA synthetase